MEETMIVARTRPPVPEEALRLTEDVRDIGEAIRLLGKIDPRNVTDDPDRDKFWLSVQRLKEYERYARRKLQTEFLDPRRTKIERNRRSIV